MKWHELQEYQKHDLDRKIELARSVSRAAPAEQQVSTAGAPTR